MTAGLRIPAAYRAGFGLGAIQLWLIGCTGNPAGQSQTAGPTPAGV